jgi:DNA-binding CsgD family transcriptional regulator
MRTVFGREPELEEIDCFLDRLLEGPAALVLAGEAGIGKTTFWSAGLSAAESRGYRTLTARPAESEAVFSFAGLADLLEPAAALLPSLPLPQRRAVEVALLSAEDKGGHPVDHRTIAVAALSMVRLLAQPGPLLIAVDDLQWLDPPTAEVLQFLGRRLGSSGAGAWAAPTRRELDRVGLRPRAPMELTTTEARVADLAASGLSTKAIAAEAFLSPKSVEGVLTRVYRKLDVSSRAQLASLMARKTDPAEQAD